MADATQQSTSTSSGQASSAGGSYFPTDISTLLESLTNPAAFAGANYANFLSNPAASPLFQAQLGPLMQSMNQYGVDARNSLTDQFRAAGGLRSGAYANAIPRLEGDLVAKRGAAFGNLLGQVFQQMTQALQAPMNQVPNLLNALKLTQQSSQSTQNSNSQSTGSSTDPTKAGSGMTASGLLQALAGMMAPKTGATGVAPTAGQTGSYSGSSTGGSTGNYNNGLLGYGQGYLPDGSVDYGQNIPSNVVDPLESTNYGYYNPGQTWDGSSTNYAEY